MTTPGNESARTPPGIIVAAIVLFVAFAAYAVRTGPLPSSDADWYMRAGDLLLADRFHVPRFLRDIDYHGAVALLYFGYTAVVALARAILGDAAATGLLILNAIALAGCAYLAMRLAWRCSGTTVAPAVVALLFLAHFELVMWVAFTLTDVTFAFFAFLSFTLAVSAGGRTRPLAEALAAVLAMLWRPTGWLVAMYAGVRRIMPLADGDRRRIAIVSAVVVMVCMLLSGAILGQIAGSPRSGFATVVLDGYRTGAVIDGRPETYLHTALPAALAGVVLVGWRLVYFFVFLADAFSSRHALVNTLAFGLTYASIGVGLWRWRSLPAVSRRVFADALLFVLALAAFHAVLGIDYDWRYRVPALPPLILAAGIGATVWRSRSPDVLRG